jgi:hypothetical protein
MSFHDLYKHVKAFFRFPDEKAKEMELYLSEIWSHGLSQQGKRVKRALLIPGSF